MTHPRGTFTSFSGGGFDLLAATAERNLLLGGFERP